jgi:hypothetical protein
LSYFNSGKVGAMMSLHAPEVVFIAEDETTITDHTEIFHASCGRRTIATLGGNADTTRAGAGSVADVPVTLNSAVTDGDHFLMWRLCGSEQ